MDDRSVLLPEGAEPARLIVCERAGRWATAMRRQPDLANIRIWETRSLAECWEMLRTAPGSFSIVELSPAWKDQLLQRIARLGREFPLARVAVVADRELSAYRWLSYESGAVCFTDSPRQLGPLARIVSKHVALAPQPVRDAAETIWARLPWATGSDASRDRSGS